MQSIDVKHAFEVAGLYEVLNPHIQKRILFQLIEVCVAAITNKDWKPSRQDREFTRTGEFLKIEVKFIMEIFRQEIIALRPKNKKPEPTPSDIRIEDAPWFYEVD